MRVQLKVKREVGNRLNRKKDGVGEAGLLGQVEEQACALMTSKCERKRE